MSREEHLFPTRRLTYRQVNRDAAEAEHLVAEPSLDPTEIHRCVMGIDETPRPMEPAEVERLRDHFAELLLKRGTFPMSLRTLIAAFDALNDGPSGLPDQESYLVPQ